jgi:acyl carrier protein
MENTINTTAIEVKVVEVVKKVAGLPKESSIDVTASLQDTYNLSSIDIIQLILGIENEFDIEYSDDYLSLEYLSSVQSITKAVTLIMKS